MQRDSNEGQQVMLDYSSSAMAYSAIRVLFTADNLVRVYIAAGTAGTNRPPFIFCSRFFA